LTVRDGYPLLWDRRGWRSRRLGRIKYGTPPKWDLVKSGTFSRDGNRILLTTSSGNASIIDTRTGSIETVFKRHSPTPVIAGEFSPDGRSVVTAAGREALVWDAPTGRVHLRLKGHAGDVSSAAFSQDGRWIITAGKDRTTRVWDARSGRLAATQNHPDEVTHAAFRPERDEFVSAGADGSVRLYPCLPCRPSRMLQELARTRVTRRLTREERNAYVDRGS
jgi:WD40 repeat protein